MELRIFDYHLAQLLEINTRVLNQSVKRNRELFLTNEIIRENKYIPSLKSKYPPFSFSLDEALRAANLFRPKKIKQVEFGIEEQVSKNLKSIEHGLKLLSRQKVLFEGYRPDIYAKDKSGVPVIIEIQKGTLDREHLYRILEYRDFYYLKFKIKPRVILLCEEFSTFWLSLKI